MNLAAQNSLICTMQLGTCSTSAIQLPHQNDGHTDLPDYWSHHLTWMMVTPILLIACHTNLPEYWSRQISPG
jgi:hypothetical protein